MFLDVVLRFGLTSSEQRHPAKNGSIPWGNGDFLRMSAARHPSELLTNVSVSAALTVLYRSPNTALFGLDNAPEGKFETFWTWLVSGFFRESGLFRPDL
jgi:hypothetical protein